MVNARVHKRSAELALAALERSPIFRSLPKGALTAFARTARQERYTVPTLLQASGELVRALRYVLEGQIEFIGRNAAGQEIMLGMIGAGGWATWLAAFDDTALGHDFYSSANARFLVFPVNAVRTLAKTHPDLYPRVINAIAQRYRGAMTWLEQSTILDQERRIAQLLILLARFAQSDEKRIVLRLSQARLAQLARCSRQSTNRTLKALSRRLPVTPRYGRIEIADLAALERFLSV